MLVDFLVTPLNSREWRGVGYQSNDCRMFYVGIITLGIIIESTARMKLPSLSTVTQFPSDIVLQVIYSMTSTIMSVIKM